MADFEKQCFAHWAATDPKHIREREAIFSRLGGLRDFLGHIYSYVQQKDALNTAPSDDAPGEID